MVGLAFARVHAACQNYCPLQVVVFQKAQKSLAKSLECGIDVAQLLAVLFIEFGNLYFNDSLNALLTIAPQVLTLLHQLDDRALNDA